MESTWKYMEIHGKYMEVHGSTWKVHGKYMEVHEGVHVKINPRTIFESFKRKEKHVQPLDIFVI